MDWIVLFVVSWIVMLIKVNYRELKVNIWGGFAAVLTQGVFDAQSLSHGLYKIENGIFNVFGTPIFFILGPVFVIGTLLSQYTLCGRWINIFNVLVISSLFSIQEWILLTRKDLIYVNWHYIDSITLNIAAMCILSWFSLIVLKKGIKENGI